VIALWAAKAGVRVTAVDLPGFELERSLAA
jgi:hypothetical protein